MLSYVLLIARNMGKLRLAQCFMHLSFDINTCVAAIPGGLCIGYLLLDDDLTCIFDDEKYIIIPERRLSDFMKLLEKLSTNLVSTQVEKVKSETFQWGVIELVIDKKQLQCRNNRNSNFELNFNISTFLSFLISIRKVAFWIAAPSQVEYEIMDFFTRDTINKSAGFPQINQIEEDINSLLKDRAFNTEKQFHLCHFLINHHCLVEFQYNLFCLTTKN